MARIIRFDRPLLLRLGLVLLLVLVIAGGALCVNGWVAATRTDESGQEDADSAEPEVPDLAAVATPAGVVHLKGALFCLDIHNRKPVLIKSAFNRRVDYIYCYSVLTAPKEGVTILHRWILDGQPVFERRLRVQGKNCRVWSRRNLMNKEPGTGRVEIVVEDGNMLGAAVFKLL
jgi:hypothetical protein